MKDQHFIVNENKTQNREYVTITVLKKKYFGK